MSFKQIDFENDAIAWVCHYGSDMRNRYIIDGFFKTASLIYENVKNNSTRIYEDDLVYPFLHTIRHTYELQLKFIMYNMYDFYKKYKKEYVQFDEETYNDIKLRHDIGNLYNFIKENYCLLDERCGEYQNIINSVYDLIDDFIPEADLDQYRYAEDRDGKENMSDITQVSFDNAYKSLKSFKEKTDCLLSFLESLNREYELGTYYKNISRHQILLIAKELPSYDKWRDKSFNEIKNIIKKEYSLKSNNNLWDILDIIKNSRWLSYYIDYNRPDYSMKIELLKKCIEFNIEISDYEEKPVSVSEIDLERIQTYNKKKKEFVDSLSNEEIVEICTYYRMGHELIAPEKYDEILNESKSILFDDGKNTRENNYFASKLTAPGFVDNIMCGAYSSGDYELFIALLDYLHTNTEVPCEEYDKAREKLGK